MNEMLRLGLVLVFEGRNDLGRKKMKKYLNENKISS